MDSRVESPQADELPRGSKTVEEPLTDDNECEVCDLEYEIMEAHRVQLRREIGQFVHLPCPQSAVSGTESPGEVLTPTPPSSRPHDR